MGTIFGPEEARSDCFCGIATQIIRHIRHIDSTWDPIQDCCTLAILQSGDILLHFTGSSKSLVPYYGYRISSTGTYCPNMRDSGVA
jgi:hypothetical protein